ncbi:MAG: RnfABCDGE type electron transport complex subunit D [Acutalibacteraceae bacterium]|nr:RnfABCDGE type electron transport complex subunit D [Acutalibacteraceae bacterium]
MTNKLIVSSSPHIHTPDTTSSIMLDVIVALLPASAFSLVLFGWRAFLLIAVCIVSCVVFEILACKLFGHDITIRDLSAVVTGLILALNLPSSLAGKNIWMAVVGCFVAIFIVKQMFGGLGHNFVNPAIAARIVLLVSFPAQMTKYYAPFSNAVSEATPLANPQVQLSVKELLFGTYGGSIGETSVIFLVIGGLYLMIRGIIKPIIPLTFMGGVALLSFATGGNPLFEICTGGVVLGAIFMATDYVTSPVTNWGKAIFGFGCGIITVIIRMGPAVEGVSFAILFMNLLVPHIDRITARKPFGWEAPQK